jgi:hypothetical protein
VKTMAEVLAEHQLNDTCFLISEPEYMCICGRRSTSHENHQEAMLTAAGFGLVKEAQAGALREAAEELTWVRPKVSPCGDTESCCGSVESCDAMRLSVRVVGADWLRARAASIEESQ